jgi:tetratricopeptide (TPR) repeat protein
MSAASEGNPHVRRGMILQKQGRYREAETCFREALGTDPHDAMSLFHLAICQHQQNRLEEGILTIQRAIALDPVNPYFHGVRSFLLTDQKKFVLALKAAEEAAALDPECVTAFTAKAAAFSGMEKWPEMEAAVREALALDPDDATAANQLALALRLQNKMAENAEQIRGMLMRDPEDAYTHSSAGWAALQQGDRAAAQTHFLEALRLQPDLESARQGLLEAFKARSPIYRAYLNYCFFMQRLSGGMRWAVVLGLYFGVKFSKVLFEKSAPSVYLGIAGLYMLLVLWVHVARGVGNFLMLLDSFARHALRPAEKRDAVAVGGSIFAGVAFLIAGFGFQWAPATIAGITLVGAAFPFAYTFLNESKAGAVVFGGVAAFVLFAGGLALADGAVPGLLADNLVQFCGGIALLLVIAATWLSNLRALNR